MNKDEYDILILGTGITESVLSVLLSKQNYKILNIDSNSFYGGSTASLNLNQLWNKFFINQTPPQHLGNDKEWNVDLCPKLIMAQGKLVQIILKFGISNYLNWQSVDGCYVYQYSKGGIFTQKRNRLIKIPIKQLDMTKTSLMNFFEKIRYKKFIQFILSFQVKNKTTYNSLHIDNMNFQNLTEEFKLSKHTINFIGHVIALYPNDSFRIKPALEVIKKIKLYFQSIGKLEKSPFIYPVYGLSNIAESFAKKSASQGSTYMLNLKIKKIEYIKNKYKITADYEDSIKPTYQFIRVCCIIDHPIKYAENNNAVQIILPQDQIGRQNDIYIVVVGPQHCVCREGYNIAIISTIKELDDIDEDLKSAYNIIGDISYKFIIQEQMYNIKEYIDNVYITKPQDETSNFESSQEDMIQIYQAITGNKLDLTQIDEKNSQLKLNL